MDVQGIASNNSLYYSPDVMGKDEFLKLLTIQLKYQDPLEPMGNTEFLAQLAQFTSLEQLMNMNGNLQANFLMMQSLNNSSSASFIGKTLRASGNSVYLPAEEDTTLHYKLASTAKVTVKIYDENGNLVRTISPETWQNAGDNEIVWDGKDSTGNRKMSGTYTFEVEAVDADGNKIGVTTFIEGTVTGVRYVNGLAIFLLGEIEVNYANILEVKGGD